MDYLTIGSALCGAVDSMTRALAVELGSKGIRINAISPGYIDDTNIQSNLSPEQMENFIESTKARVPLQRTGKSVELADAAFFLAII